MTFDVHLYATVRVKLASVEAENAIEAVKAAESSVNLYELFRVAPAFQNVSEIEYAEDITGYLVDECGEKPRVYGQWLVHEDVYTNP